MLHNDSWHFRFKKAERQPSTPAEPLFHTCTSERRAGETEKQECWEREDVGNWWAVARACCTNTAERMGAARTSSSADGSHGCGSYAVIAAHRLDTPSFLPSDILATSSSAKYSANLKRLAEAAATPRKQHHSYFGVQNTIVQAWGKNKKIQWKKKKKRKQTFIV